MMFRNGIAALARRPQLWIAALVLALTVPLVPHSHFYGDDYIQIGTVEGVFDRFGSAPLDLYGFADGSRERAKRQVETGPMPWFVDPEMKVHFFRPVSSALLTLDHALFGRQIRAYRIQAILWYLLLVLAFAAWARRMIPAVGGAIGPSVVLAVIIFVVSDSHWVNVLWTAGRWVLVATALALVGCVAHLRWRLQGWRPGRYLSLAAVAVALLSGEVALAVLAYLAAFEIVATGGKAQERASALAPFVALVGIYLIVYMALGFGAAATDDYVNPLTNPFGYLSQLPGRMLAMCGEIFLWFNAGMWNVESLRGTVALAGVGGLVFITVLLAPLYRVGSAAERIAIGRLLLGTFGSMLVLAAGSPGSRNLVIPFIGTSALVGIALYHWWTILRRKRGVIQWAAALVCLGAGLVHLGIAPYRWLTEPSHFKAGSDAQASLIRSLDFADENVPDQRTVFLTMHFTACWNGYFLRKFEGLAMPACWWTISAADCVHRYNRTGPDRLVLETVGGEMMTTWLESVVRSAKRPIREGDTVELRGLSIRVLEVGDRGPTRVELTFDRALDDPSLNFMTVVDGELRRVELPPVGGTLTLQSPW
jgi:hypothetical protein